MAGQKLTYKILEDLGRELKAEGTLEVRYVKEELDIVEKGVRSMNPNMEKIFGGRYRDFVLLFDVMLSADGLNDLYKRAVAGKLPQLEGLERTTFEKIVLEYNQPDFWIFNIDKNGISLRQKIPNFQLSNILKTVVERVQSYSYIYSNLAKELQPFVENFEKYYRKFRSEDGSELSPKETELKRVLGDKIQGSVKIYP